MVSSILGKSQSLVGSCQDCTAAGEALAIHNFPKFPILHLWHEAARQCMFAGHWARWGQSVSPSISRPRFAEQGPRSMPINTNCSLLKSGSQLSRKSERLLHPTGCEISMCRTFEMGYVLLSYMNEDFIDRITLSHYHTWRLLQAYNITNITHLNEWQITHSTRHTL